MAGPTGHLMVPGSCGVDRGLCISDTFQGLLVLLVRGLQPEDHWANPEAANNTSAFLILSFNQILSELVTESL